MAMSFLCFTARQIPFLKTNQRRRDRQSVWHIWEDEERIQGFGGET